MNQSRNQSPGQSPNQSGKQSNTETEVEVTKADLPLHCPTPDSSLWNSHPRVYIAVEESGEAKCPYCGTVYRLVDQ